MRSQVVDDLHQFADRFAALDFPDGIVSLTTVRNLDILPEAERHKVLIEFDLAIAQQCIDRILGGRELWRFTAGES